MYLSSVYRWESFPKVYEKVPFSVWQHADTHRAGTVTSLAEPSLTEAMEATASDCSSMHRSALRT